MQSKVGESLIYSFYVSSLNDEGIIIIFLLLFLLLLDPEKLLYLLMPMTWTTIKFYSDTKKTTRNLLVGLIQVIKSRKVTTISSTE